MSETNDEVMHKTKNVLRCEVKSLKNAINDLKECNKKLIKVLEDKNWQHGVQNKVRYLYIRFFILFFSQCYTYHLKLRY